MIRDFIKPFWFILIALMIFSIALIYNKRTDDAFIDRGRVTFEVAEPVDSSLVLTQDNAVLKNDEDIHSDLFPECYFVLLVNNDTGEIYAAKNAHKRMYPASLTKLMTATVVCEEMDRLGREFDEVVTVTNRYDLSAEGGGVSPLAPGSKITVRNLLAGLLIQSNNYYGLILADYISGSEATFVELMNKKASEIGATNTHFANPHGLDDVNHYSSGYDIYLILKEASKYDIINELDSYTEYDYTYENYSGYDVSVSITPTNWFLQDNLSLPANYIIKNWKTGTTDGAGSCLAMLIENTSLEENNSYIVIASSSETKQELYDAIIKLLCLIE